MKYPGKLISIEGLDGCGKSTLAHELATELQTRGCKVVLTKEHGGTPLGTKLRQIVHSTTEKVCAKTEFLLIAADRAQHFYEVVVPALQAGAIVISDRMDDSSLAYQGYGRELDLDLIATVNRWAMNNITKDLVLYLVLDYQTALKRVGTRQETLTSFEQEKAAFWKKVSAGYEKIFAGRPEVARLDASNKPAVIVRQAVEILQKQGIIS